MNFPLKLGAFVAIAASTIAVAYEPLCSKPIAPPSVNSARRSHVCEKTVLLLVRHGQTAWNKQKIVHGQVDVPLNDEGLLEAEALAHRLKGRVIANIYSSDLQRAFRPLKSGVSSR